MIHFKELFHFSETEVSCFFKQAKKVKSVNGLKLLRCASPLAGFDHPAFDYGKLLVVTPRKAGKAHERNKIRRQIKEIFYTNQLYLRQGYSVVLVYKDAINVSFGQLTDFFLTNIIQQ